MIEKLHLWFTKFVTAAIGVQIACMKIQTNGFKWTVPVMHKSTYFKKKESSQSSLNTSKKCVFTLNFPDFVSKQCHFVSF